MQIVKVVQLCFFLYYISSLYRRGKRDPKYCE